MSIAVFKPGTLIEVIGNVASGKTTFAKKLAELSNLKDVDVDLFWKNPFMELCAKDPERWSFAQELNFIYNRYTQIKPVKERLKNEALVLDHGFHVQFYMYSKNRLRQGTVTQAEWDFLETMQNHFMENAPEPQITLHLQEPVEELTRRMDLRGRPFEKHYQDEYLPQLQVGIDEYLDHIIEENRRETIITYSASQQKLETRGKEQPELNKLLKKASEEINRD